MNRWWKVAITLVVTLAIFWGTVWYIQRTLDAKARVADALLSDFLKDADDFRDLADEATGGS